MSEVTATVWLAPQGDAQSPLRAVTMPIDRPNLAQALAAPAVACIETGLNPAQAPGADPSGLTLCLSSRQAFACDPGTAFVEQMIARRWLDLARRSDALLALHEALANAIIHGNLEMDGGNPTTPEDFIEHGRILTERLESDEYGLRALTLTAVFAAPCLVISIIDSGKGFAPKATEAIPAEAKNGRGVSLMQSATDGVRHEDGGRAAILTFVQRGDAL